LKTSVWLILCLVAPVIVGCEGCLVFSDRYWKWRLAGSLNSSITLISDSPEVRHLLAEEDAREEAVSQFWREPHTKEEGRRHVEDMIQHPDAYPPGRTEFLKAMSLMPKVTVPGRSYCDVIEQSKSKCGRLPLETASYVLVQITSGPANGSGGWVCRQQVQPLFP
jgi:hypothetical protein